MESTCASSPLAQQRRKMQTASPRLAYGDGFNEEEEASCLRELHSPSEMGLREEEEQEAGALAALGWFQDSEEKDFLPLEEKEQRIWEKKQLEETENTAPVLYMGHIPHGFYEDQMQGFFQQLGAVKKRVRTARNHKTGKSKHYGSIEFEIPKIAPVAPEKVHAKV